jgi:hypothetical protein
MTVDFEIAAPELPPVGEDQTATNPAAPYGYKADGTPYKRRPNKSGTRTVRAPRAGKSTVDIAAGMQEMYDSVGFIALMRGDVELAQLMIGPERLQEMIDAASTGPMGASVSQAAGTAWAKIASQSDGWNTALTKLLETGVWAEVLNAHLPLLMLTVKRKPKMRLFRKFFMRRRVQQNGQAKG